MKRWTRLVMTATVLPALTAALLLVPGTREVESSPIGNHVLRRALDVALGKSRPAKYQMPLSAGVVYSLLAATGELDRRTSGGSAPRLAPDAPASTLGTQGCPKVRLGAVANNVRVNQDCSLRRQAEEVIAINPLNEQNLIAGQNDSRVGFNHCGYDWSFNGGRSWGDQIPPFYQTILADGTVADACSDPTATFDAQGNAYVGGILFGINTAGNGIVVAKSNAGIGGQFYHIPDSSDPFQLYKDAPLGVVANDSGETIFNDKELMVADASRVSPKANNVYMTWTRFNDDTGQGVGSNSPIYFSQSTNGGTTWSTGIEISGSSPNCTDFSGESDPNACDQDQGSHPVVGKDGTIYVVFGNGNTPVFGFNQVMFVKCPGTVDCSVPSNWSAPVKVNNLVGTHPIGPDPSTGCPAGRQCLPPNGYRVAEFTSMSISVDNSGRLFIVWADFRNGGPPCDTLNALTSTPPCNNDVFYAASINGGASWSPARNVYPAGVTAQWQPWSDVTSDGKALWVAFYDRHYGNCEFTGCNDITLARVGNPVTPTGPITYTRLTTSSMPNLVPANNPVQAGFLGDYMWVEVSKTGKPHVVWADTRGRMGTVEEDVYFALPR